MGSLRTGEGAALATIRGTESGVEGVGLSMKKFSLDHFHFPRGLVSHQLRGHMAEELVCEGQWTGERAVSESESKWTEQAA